MIVSSLFFSMKMSVKYRNVQTDMLYIKSYERFFSGNYYSAMPVVINSKTDLILKMITLLMCTVPLGAFLC